MPDQEQVTVYEARDPVQAELVRNVLENEGIGAWVQGESQGGFSHLMEIQVVVSSADEARAREVIAFHQGPTDDLADDEAVAEDMGDADEGLELPEGK